MTRANEPGVRAGKVPNFYVFFFELPNFFQDFLAQGLRIFFYRLKTVKLFEREYLPPWYPHTLKKESLFRIRLPLPP